MGHSIPWRASVAPGTDLPWTLEVAADHPGSSLGAACIAGRGVGLYTVYRELYRRTHGLMAAVGGT